MNTTAGITAHKVSIALPTSRELALEYGLVEPTPEERTAAERRAAEYARVGAAHDERMAAFRQALAAVTDPVARVVLDLHSEACSRDCLEECGIHFCGGCDFAGYDAESPDWPCRTVEAVAGVLGLTVPRP